MRSFLEPQNPQSHDGSRWLDRSKSSTSRCKLLGWWRRNFHWDPVKSKICCFMMWESGYNHPKSTNSMWVFNVFLQQGDSEWISICPCNSSLRERGRAMMRGEKTQLTVDSCLRDVADVPLMFMFGDVSGFSKSFANWLRYHLWIFLKIDVENSTQLLTG